jgi:hypothetical protein
MTAAAIATTATVEAARITGAFLSRRRFEETSCVPLGSPRTDFGPDHPLHERLSRAGVPITTRLTPAVEKLLQLGVPLWPRDWRRCKR